MPSPNIAVRDFDSARAEHQPSRPTAAVASSVCARISVSWSFSNGTNYSMKADCVQYRRALKPNRRHEQRFLSRSCGPRENWDQDGSVNPCVSSRRRAVYYALHPGAGFPHPNGRYFQTWHRRCGRLSPTWLQIGSRSLGELEITRSTSDVAACCSNASPSSRVRRATSVSSPAGDELEGAAAFGTFAFA